MSELNEPHGTLSTSGEVTSGSLTLLGGLTFDGVTDLANANDGNGSTYATFPSGVTSSAGGGTAVRRVHSDLGTAYTVTSIVTSVSVGGSPVSATAVEYSSDGVSWSTAAGAWTGTSPRTFTLTTPTAARYWRIVYAEVQGSGLDYWPALLVYTWEIWGDAASVADFIGTPLSGGAPLSVAFTDLSTGTPIAWAWDFGDGDTSTDQNPTHVYATAGSYTVELEATYAGPTTETETKVAYVVVTAAPEAWDVYAAEDPNGPIIATLSNAEARQIRIELNGPGSGSFRINRHAAEATLNVLRKGNLVKVRIPAYGEDYIFAFWIETGDFDLLSTDEEGGEVLTFGGKGALAYLDRARMWSEAFTTGLDISATWTEIWESTAVYRAVGSAYFAADSGYVYVIDKTTRRVYRINQSTQAATVWSGALFSGYAGGMSGDPSDATIYWALEAPWLSGSGSVCNIHKVRLADNVILATYNIGTNHFAGIRSDGTDLWLPNQSDNKIYKKSVADGSTIASYSVSYNGVAQTVPTGVSANGTQLALWFNGTARALIVASSDPTTVVSVLSTQDIQAFGGDWTTESGEDYFYMVSDALHRVWKYQVTAATPRDPVDGIWRLDEGSAGAILARIIAEFQAPERPQQPIPDLTYAFDFDLDSDGNAWTADDAALEFTAEIGDSGLDTVLRLIRFGLTLQMTPNLELGGYNSFGTSRTSATFASGKVRFVAGSNIAEGLHRQMVSQRVDSHLLAQGESGLFATSTDDDLGYVREGFISTQLTDTDALTGVAAAELARQRTTSESLVFVPDWGNSELTGKYLPYVHYWVGDTVRVHTGTGEFDYDEDDFRIYAINLAEQENGDWQPTVELAEGIVEPTGGGSSDGGGGGGLGGAAATTSSSGITVREEGTTGIVASTIESPDWSVVEIADRVARILMQWPELGRLADVDVVEIPDGGSIRRSESEGAWVPAEKVYPHGNMGAAATLDVADGLVHTGTLDDDCTVTVEGFTTGHGLVMLARVAQDGTGGRAITWDADVVFLGNDQPGQTAGDVTHFLLWSDEGDATVYAARIGSGGLTIQDEGTPLATLAETLNVTGAGATVSGTGPTKTLDIPGTTAADIRDAGRWEVIMAPGVTSPPDPVQTPDGSDWTYGWVPG